MTRPYLSQHATVAEFQTAFNAWHAKAHDFSKKVDKVVEEQYGLYDGGDLCYNLLEAGESRKTQPLTRLPPRLRSTSSRRKQM